MALTQTSQDLLLIHTVLGLILYKIIPLNNSSVSHSCSRIFSHLPVLQPLSHTKVSQILNPVPNCQRSPRFPYSFICSQVTLALSKSREDNFSSSCDNSPPSYETESLLPLHLSTGICKKVMWTHSGITAPNKPWGELRMKPTSLAPWSWTPQHPELWEIHLFCLGHLV